MGFRSKAEAKRLLRAIRQKSKKIYMEWSGSSPYAIFNTADISAIEKIVDRAEKRLK
jgi:acyl-CoA reductase-like NAD-dependent aldehyde dehydrogenase